MYSQLSPDFQSSQRATPARLIKIGIALGSGSCLLLLASLTCTTQFRGSADAGVNLIAQLATPQRFRSIAKGPSQVMPKGLAGARQLLPGPSPWKELALSAMEEMNVCGRDVSVKAAESGKPDLSKLQAGITPPLGFFDPLALATQVSYGRLLFYREVELKHGRICMLAALGILVGEQFHPLFGGDIDVPAYIAFQQTPLQQFWIYVAAAIAIPELYSTRFFNEPSAEYQATDTWTMKEDRVPGDLGFDPLGLKPTDEKAFLELQNKEILNGRLAMIATAGMIIQELYTGKKLFD